MLALSLNGSAYFLSRGNDDVVPRSSRSESVVPRADAANRATGHPNSRPANFSQHGSLFLRTGPRSVLVEFNIRTGGYAEVQIELGMKIFQMAMPIDESGQNSFAFDVDDLGAFGNCDVTAHANSSNSPCFNHDNRIFKWWPACAVD